MQRQYLHPDIKAPYIGMVYLGAELTAELPLAVKTVCKDLININNVKTSFLS